MKSLAVGIGHAVLAKGILLISQSAYAQYGESLPTHHETTREIGGEINRETTRGLPTPCVRFAAGRSQGLLMVGVLGLRCAQEVILPDPSKAQP